MLTLDFLKQFSRQSEHLKKQKKQNPGILILRHAEKDLLSRVESDADIS